MRNHNPTTAPRISIVVALNPERVIGSNNQLPWHIPEDLAYFKATTLGKPIIMGRKTFESIGRVLPARPNVVISRSGFIHPGVSTYADLPAALAAFADVAEICIIGGGEVFKQALPLADELHLTWVDVPHVADPCAWFPEVDMAEWLLLTSKSFVSSVGIACRIEHYARQFKDELG